jgi:hypothetical protein
MFDRIAREKKTVEKMISIYCRYNHRTAELCNECSEMLSYAHNKLDKCPFGSDKPACNNCLVHCYRQQEKEKIKEIMRFAGPKMLTKHPFLAIMHLLDRNREIRDLKKQKK